MAKETKTVQCYPSDDKINAMVERYASFGWELINNQRCQEFTGQTFDSDGSSTSHYSTFNKLTFTREKTSSWYSQVTELEDRYNSLMDQKPTDTSVEPSKKPFAFVFLFVVVGAVALIVGLGMGGGLIFTLIGAGIWALGLLLTVIYFIKRSHYKKDYREYLDKDDEFDRTLGAQAREIMRKADRIVNGG